jgi:phytoene dehydrogenase-like protein
MGAIVDALVDAIEEGGSTVALSTPVAKINLDVLGRRAVGVTTAKVGNRKSTELRTKSGVVCNAPAWCLADLLGVAEGKRGEEVQVDGTKAEESSSPSMNKPSLSAAAATFVDKTQVLGMTQSYMHLHLTLDATGLDLEALEAHYTVT